MVDAATETEVVTFCPLCVSRCGAHAVVSDDTFSLTPDPSHPTGQTLCVKGRAAPQITASPERLRYPLRRTRTTGAADPGWEHISGDEARGTVADPLLAIAREHGSESVAFGSESVAFGSVSPSTSAIVDAVDRIQRLQRRSVVRTWSPRWTCPGGGATSSRCAPVARRYRGCTPDLEQAGCILFWGYNPSVSRLAHATATLPGTS